MIVQTTVGSMVYDCSRERVLSGEQIVDLDIATAALKDNDELNPLKKVAEFEKITGHAVIVDIPSGSSIGWTTPCRVFSAIRPNNSTTNKCKSIW